jgi:hypothetical protein
MRCVRAGAVAFLLAVVVMMLAGCDRGIDRDAYVEKNVRLLDSLPVLPGARPARTESSPYSNNDTPGAQVVGFGTTRTFVLPPRLLPPQAIDAYARLLAARGWEVVDRSMVPSVSARHRDAYVHVLAAPREVLVEVDHDCYKGSSTPQCFGP